MHCFAAHFGTLQERTRTGFKDAAHIALSLPVPGRNNALRVSRIGNIRGAGI
jgi:hypothetical protein